MLLVIAVALPFFISLNEYIPCVEKEVSVRLKEPGVDKKHKVRGPAVAACHGRRHHGRTTDDIRLGKVLVIPDFFSLLPSTKVYREHRD